MSRTFTKNVSNFLNIGTSGFGNLINGLAAVSVHFWVKPASYDVGGFNNRILGASMSAGSGAFVIAVDGSGANKVLACGGRSQLADGFQSKVGTTTLGTGAYKSVGAVFNYGAATITPYIAGTAEGGGSVTFGSGTYVHTASVGFQDCIGAASDSTTTADQFAGDIAEFAVWNTALTAGNFTSLAAGAAATAVARANLISYMRLLGTASPETDSVDSLVGTITGSIPQGAHPTINTMPFNRYRNQAVNRASVY